jgi:hypothetical protein
MKEEAVIGTTAFEYSALSTILYYYDQVFMRAECGHMYSSSSHNMRFKPPSGSSQHNGGQRNEVGRQVNRPG